MANPLSPIYIPPSTKKPPPSARTVMKRLRLLMAVASVIAIALHSVPLMILGAAVWAFWIIYYLLLTRVLDPDGKDTPYVNQHSQIQAMVMRSDYAGAAAAYRQAMVENPADALAAEHLVQLARRELKDPELALWAAREAERRQVNAGRRVFYGMLAVELLRRDLNDPRRAVVELSRLIASYPDAPNAAALRAELEELKAGLFAT